MKIQYFSDVHLEFGFMPLALADADVIVAAGDIGVQAQGLHWLRHADKPVIYVAGNHEFYKGEYHATLLSLRRQAEVGPVEFLERDCHIHKGVRFLGCTLWTALQEDEAGDLAALRGRVNDFKHIRCGSGALLLNDYVHWHRGALAWLREELDKPYHGKTVVVTHHAPLLDSWRGLPNSPKVPAYCNDLGGLLEKYDIAAWFHGHTHFANDYTAHGTRVLCNPRGYNGYKLVRGFDAAKVVEI
ncbi:metallophosphoesterase [Methylogaea oryzae]|uniref:Serine/threonine protein phosphatase n=1 Tax=Methylogaea oryzae TaxID=1295382 RepID=A0A8D5AJ59_9GAMM|nr:metallophosphoesterase [Methylogaea oryzae]BBL70439.1 serine/threonine protein phosphatase [Methylogaea oryzae]